ncbi:MAG TPA: hypothetical protein VGM35_06695, partial [Xanthobacteraceae bacterium]
MIRAWLDMHPVSLFLTLAILSYGMVLLLAVIAFRSPLTRPLHSIQGIVAPFFGAVAILFALLT